MKVHGVRGSDGIVRQIEERAGVQFVRWSRNAIHRVIIVRRLSDGVEAGFPMGKDLRDRRTYLNVISQIRQWARGVIQWSGQGRR